MNEWNASIFDCSKNKTVCIVGSMCLPCLLLVNRMRAEKLHGTEVVNPWWILCMSCLFCPLYPCIQSVGRYYIREKYNLVEKPCNDKLVHCFCCYCAACQEVNELNVNGAPQVYSSDFC